MAKPRNITLSAFNIVTHPHSRDSYEQLLFKARELRQIVKIWGDTHALLRSVFKLQEYDRPILTGEIFTFLQLDVNGDWFDIIKGEVAGKDLTSEVYIPENLRPHLKRIRYLFFPDVHTFVYAQYDSSLGKISANRLQEFLTRLFNDNRILETSEFHEVDVRLVQDKRSIDWIFEHIRVERLEIAIRTPNGDTGGDAEKSVEEELEDQNIEEYFVRQTAVKGKSIQPDERTKRLLNEATTNGYVEAKGVDIDDIPRTVNTRERPLREPFYYDEKRKTYMQFMVDAATSLIEKIKKNRKE